MGLEMSWRGKALGVIAEEMQGIHTLDEAVEYKQNAIESFGGEAIINMHSKMSADEWFYDYVRSIDERRRLPDIWLSMMYRFYGGREPHNATPTQHENATDAENSHETDT